MWNVTEEYYAATEKWTFRSCTAFLFRPTTCIWLYSTRNSSGDEIANVNFLYNDIVNALQNTIDLCIISATDRRGYVLEHRFTKFS